jgi:hypothetical protein
MIKLLLWALAPSLVQAYLPPAFYVYNHIAEQRAKAPNPAVQISVSRPTGAGTEEVLGSLTVSHWSGRSKGWPALRLLFSGEGVALIQSVQAFGIPVAKESELLRARPEQFAAMKEAPKPFYKSDKRMSLKRYRQTYAWVHKEDDRSIWLEKDTFLPLKIEGPCPTEVTELGWAKSGDNLCELEFRNVYSLRRGTPQNSRLTIWKDGAPVLFFSFDRVLPPKSGGAPALAAESSLPANLAAIADTILH